MGAVSEEDLEAIARGTDGWAIALAAVRDWLASGWSTARVRDSLKLPAADLSRYVTSQILQGLSASEREFLLRTAIVDRFCEPLAEALCGDLPVREAIRALEHKDLLVVIWDGNERWFRYHRLLAELAIAELARVHEGQAAGLHRSAAEWFFRSGHHAEAVRHALATGDDRLLAELFERAGGWQLVCSGHVGLSRNALTFISPQVLRDYPRAQLARILMLAKLAQTDEANRELERLRAMHLPSDDALLEKEVELLRALVDRYVDTPVDDEYYFEIEAVASSVPRDHSPLRAAFANILCALQYERGELEPGLAIGDDAIVHYRRMSSLFGEVFVYVHQGRILHENGRLRDAEATLRQAWTLARDTTGPNTETEAVAAVALATSRVRARRSGRGGNSARHRIAGDRARARAGSTCSPSAISPPRRWPRIARARAGVRAVAARARETGLRRDMERLLRVADILDLQGHVLSGELHGRALALLEAALSSGLAREHAPRIRLRISLDLARLALARGQFHTAREAGAQLAEQGRAIRHLRLSIEAHLVEALAAHALGEPDAAGQAFGRAVNLGMHEGFRQVFCDFGDSLLPLLDEVEMARPAPGAPRVRDRFLQSARRLDARPGTGGDRRSEPERTRAHGAAAAGRRAVEQSHRPRAAGLGQHREIPPQEHLHEARRQHARRSRAARLSCARVQRADLPAADRGTYPPTALAPRAARRTNTRPFMGARAWECRANTAHWNRRRRHQHRCGADERPRRAGRPQDPDHGRRRVGHAVRAGRGAAAGGSRPGAHPRRDDRHDALHERVRSGALARPGRRHSARCAGDHQPAAVRGLAGQPARDASRARSPSCAVATTTMAARLRRSDPGEIRRAAKRCATRASARSRSPPCSLPVNDAQERFVRDIVCRVTPDAAVTLSSELGRIGLLERENAAIMNASLAGMAGEVVRLVRRGRSRRSAFTARST